MADSPIPLAVEIYVTHVKEEEDRDAYTKLEHDVLKNDLSGLAWDARSKEVEAAVL